MAAKTVGERRYISIAQAASFSGLSASSLRRMIADGELRAFRPRGTIRLDSVELDKVIRASVGK